MTHGRAQTLLCIAILLPLAGCMGEPVEFPARDRFSYLLDAVRYPQLLLEIDHMRSTPPSTAAIEHLVDELKRATGRRDVRAYVTQMGIESPSLLEEKVWSSEELDELAEDQRDLAPRGDFANGSAAVVHILYLEGKWAESEAVGLATQQAAFLFGSRQIAPSPVDREPYIERSVLTHEVGHLLGLVNNGIPMVKAREDPEDDGHSTNVDSVMYRGVDAGKALLANVDETNAPPSHFDADDIADLAAYRQWLLNTRPVP